MTRANRTFIAKEIELVDHDRLIPADYNPREMDPRTLRILVRSLARFGWVLPVVANRRTGRIVGGHQRIRANAQVIKTNGRRAAAYRKVPVIYVDLPDASEKALNVALNQISGDWDFFKRAAADELRQNATFAQMTRKHHRLSNGYRAPLGLKRFDFGDAEHLRRFISTHGTRILDFGCGRGQEVEWLRKVKISAHGFEPFRRVAGSNRLDVEISRAQAKVFLALLSRGFLPDTVFCNFVISSIATPRERNHVLNILRALGAKARSIIVAVRSTYDTSYQQVIGNVRASKGGYLGIPDAAERGLVVTGAGTAKQKFQKFYERDDFVRMLRRHFKSVELATFTPQDKALVGVCRDPKPLPTETLHRALRFEFDMPVNGESIGYGDLAVKMFARWMRR